MCLYCLCLQKEFLLSTDNIVAKIKDAARTNLMLSSGVQIDKTKYPAELPNNVSEQNSRLHQVHKKNEMRQ